ncbi:hypothetical protein SADUNF_Sadunf16G0109200 [Salix dunnii]|uniref:Uncharacterized protein n=1 Tax=Salix dunnii TaxID=1413687 RepID=A0A835J928_9ROSI|nr:hypothetical protein SADUNF_Sadunf16G0109200 [Salix dunnii]
MQMLYTSAVGGRGLLLLCLQCHNSKTLALCIQCIKSDPRAPYADKVGIAAIVILCVRNHSRTLASNKTKVASREDNEKLQSAYQSCSKGFVKAIKYILKRERPKGILSYATDRRKDEKETFLYVFLYILIITTFNRNGNGYRLISNLVRQSTVSSFS